MKTAIIVLSVLLNSVSAGASILLEVSAGPATSASAKDTITFSASNPVIARLEYAPLLATQLNEEFACADYPDADSFCEGFFGGTLSLLKEGSVQPILVRFTGTSYFHHAGGVIVSGDDGGCVFDPQPCTALLMPGTYILSVALDVSIAGHNGATPAPVLRSLAGAVTLESDIPQDTAPEPGTLLVVATVVGGAVVVRRVRSTPFRG